MGSVLQDYEARLQVHFSALAEEKRRERFPVFALEHCLDPHEIKGLGKELGRSLRSLQGLAPNYRLCWLVHAAEVGYDFDGQEYWHRFGQATPNWNYTYRNEFLTFFEVFAKQFGGVRPTGQWAQGHRFIAWPVAHALLPHDLQLLLARSIYNARHRLPDIARLDAASTGEFVDHHTFEWTTRYRYFLQQRELVGWIVHALMRAGGAEASILHPPTLNRILDNLNAVAHTREWLKDAQKQYARSTFNLPWSARQAGSSPTRLTPADLPQAGASLMKALLTPLLNLRFDGGQGRARAYVELPSFQQLINLHPEFRSHFEMANVRIPCHGDALMPAVMLLSGSGRQRALRRWPGAEEVLAEFKPSLQHFDQLVSAECRLPKGDLWLFKRVGEAASQVEGMTLRPGERYVVVSRDKARLKELPGQPLQLGCEGVQAFEFDVPSLVPEALVKLYRATGMSVHRTIRIEPVGLYPRAWGGDSLGEWLITETPCFVLERDHAFDSYQISINNGLLQTFRCSGEGSVIISFDGLEVGTHTIDLATRYSSNGTGPQVLPCASGSFKLHVRLPSTWIPGLLCSPALVVEVHPVAPTLTDFLNGEIDLCADGDTSRHVNCSLELLDESGQTSATLPIGRHALPMTSSHWSELVHALLNRPSDEYDFLAAAGAQIVLDADDLGQKRIALLHTPSPVRWALSRTKDAAVLRLIDEGADQSIDITWTDFTQPMTAVPLGRDEAHEIDVASKSGLFLAHAGEYREAVIVSPREVGRGLSWLGIRFSPTAFQERDLLKVLAANDLWRGARPCAPLSRLRQRQVTTSLHRYGLELVTGSLWMQKEQQLESKLDDRYWNDLESIVSADRSYGISLCYNWRTADAHDDKALQDVARSVAKSFREFAGEEVLALAWLFSGDKPQLNLKQRETLLGHDEGNFATLVRAARLLRLYRQHRRGLAKV